MDYKQTTEFLFSQFTSFGQKGDTAYKPGLERTLTLSDAFGSPHERLKVIHVAGTNGKGTVAHTLAAILQSAGYRVGLFTSPHLVDFRERIKVDGVMIPEDRVVSFVERYIKMSLGIEPSFFEFTTIMALEYFDEMQVDVAVVEVGLGGRLDSTNIVRPSLCVITNISLDHTALLGTTRRQIAGEKAGIIKWKTPVVVGEPDDEIRSVFDEKAYSEHAPIVYATDHQQFRSAEVVDGKIIYYSTEFGTIQSPLTGTYQLKNTATILASCHVLRRMHWRVSGESVSAGFAGVVELTGLLGRWTVVSTRPFTVIDTGHNPGAWRFLARQLSKEHRHKHIVLGFVSDKDVDSILDLLPHDAEYYFTQPSVHRALDRNVLEKKAISACLSGKVYADVNSAYSAAITAAADDDFVYVGGSTYLVADFLRNRVLT